jgi:hypothetical protein
MSSSSSRSSSLRRSSASAIARKVESFFRFTFQAICETVIAWPSAVVMSAISKVSDACCFAPPNFSSLCQPRST